MFKEFLGFLVATGLCHHKVNHSILIMFMPYLSENGLFVSNIANYITGIKSQCIIYDIDISPFKHEQIQLFSKALKINRPLSAIISVTNILQFPVQFSALYYLAFFTFLKISNILPHSTSTFDPSRQLSRGMSYFLIWGRM